MRALFCAALMAVSMRAAANDAVPADRLQVEKKLGSVATLIDKSSAARQIEVGGTAAARERRDQARSLHARAVAAFQAGDYPAAATLLDQAAREMFEAVRLAAPEQVTNAKKRADFDARLESVKVLLEAQRRIGSEKGSAAAGEATRRIEQLVREAKELSAAGKLDQARLALDQAYLTAKASIGGMREGDTLVRTLTFANKEEEYRYEVDRNDTHQMLIRVLLEEKRQSGSTDKMVQGYQDKAAEFRRQAETSAGRKDFESAIRLLEQATAELVRAIRSAGVYIPG